jgi:sulfhydrogenase subunit beta (sulfur reductase)
MYVLELKDFDALFGVLKKRGYTIVGPVAREGAIQLDELSAAVELPRGWGESQEPGHYELAKTGSDEFFGYTLGPLSWKRYLFPPHVTLFAAKRNGKGFDVIPPADATPPAYALLGVRSCELAALKIHDRIFLEGRYADPVYAAHRARTLVVAVNCTRAGGNCFCASMGTGPAAKEGYDLVLTEMKEDSRHYFLIAAGSARGEEILDELPRHDATAGEEGAASARSASVAAGMAKTINTENLKQVFYANFEHPEWDEVAKRCLACANCTMVCPTCFCTTVQDHTDLTGEHAERTRRWDSCFTMDFTRVAGGNVRPSKRARYRQWLSHKFAYWTDQFGTSGCVGCGRCITWCPAGIDIVAEVNTLQRTSITNGAL